MGKTFQDVTFCIIFSQIAFVFQVIPPSKFQATSGKYLVIETNKGQEMMMI